jgi:hypothetical protein
MNRRAYRPYIVVIVFLFFLVACDDRPKKEAKPSADWSRSTFLGEDVAGSISLMTDNGQIHMVWPMRKDGESSIRYVKLNERGQTTVDRILEFDGHLRNTYVVQSGDKDPHLIWSSRLPGESDWQIWHARLNEAGDIIKSPTVLSDDDMRLGKYVVESDGHGGAIIAWDSGSQGPLYAIRLGLDGTMASEPNIVTDEGELPSIYVDHSGNVHMTWYRDGGFYYKSFPLDDLATGEESLIVIPTHINLGLTGDTMVGPVVAYEDGWVYVFWSIHSTTDVEAGSAQTEYIVFQEDDLRSHIPNVLRMLDSKEQPYDPYSGDLGITQLVEPPDLSTSNTNFIVNPAVMDGSHDNLVVGLIVEQPYGLEEELQSAAAVFEDGEYAGYTIAGKTERISDDPILAVDGSGNLHMVWREGSGGREVYYATTSPTALASLDRLEANDVINAVPEGMMDSFASFAFVPFVGLCWMLPGFLLIGIWSLAKEAKGISERSSRILFIVAVAVYYTMKILFLPSIMTYTPFSAWLYVPDAYALILRIAIPLMIFVLALFAAVTVRKRYTKSLLAVYLSFVFTDAALTLAIYGVNFQGSF